MFVFKKTLNFSESPVKESRLALWNVKSHFLRIFAVFIFFEAAQESHSKARPKQITIFTPMLNFFTAETPNLHNLFKFTNFVASVFFFACACFAEMYIKTAGNVEIASFIESESKRILQVPDSSTLTLNFQTAKDEHGRAWFLFFLGERKVSIKADYILAIPGKEALKNSLKADTSWFTGYCGMIECQNKPMPAHQRIETLKYLVSKILTELNGKLYLLFAEKKIAKSASSANPIDSVAAPIDSTTQDSTTTKEQK